MLQMTRCSPLARMRSRPGPFKARKPNPQCLSTRNDGETLRDTIMHRDLKQPPASASGLGAWRSGGTGTLDELDSSWDPLLIPFLRLVHLSCPLIPLLYRNLFPEKKK